MTKSVSAWLVYGQEEPMGALRVTLEAQAVQTRQARDCKELSTFLKSGDLPHLIFTDRRLADGTWEDVLDLATRAPEPISVIVVARFADMRWYIEALERGAFDFIIPPFAAPAIEHVVKSGLGKALERRQALAHAA